MRTLLIIAVLVSSSLGALSQQALTVKDFLGLVKKYHPVVKQASLGVEIAKAEVTSARAGFDPQFQHTNGRKELEGLLYYDHQISEVKVPTWYGVDVIAGMESLSGQRTSNPDTKGNSSYFGFSIPVAKGLLMDGRRAALQQAKIFQQLSIQEQRTVINDLLFDASGAYWMWWQQYHVQVLFKQAIKNAEERFRMVKTAFQIGERPAIDTVEALAQLQAFQIRASELQLDVANAQLELSVFLWQTNGDPYLLPESVIPEQQMFEKGEVLQFQKLLEEVQLHPELQQYRFKLNALQVEKRLKFQSLLPAVNLKYNQLNKSHDLRKSFTTPWLENNFRYGMAISIPLRFSEGRGEYRQAKLKIEQTELDRFNKQILLQTKLRQYYNEWKALGAQIALGKQALQSYTVLQKGEELKFANGESSLFLVNARELKTLEAQQKVIELQGKEQKAAAGSLWAAGTLANF